MYAEHYIGRSYGTLSNVLPILPPNELGGYQIVRAYGSHCQLIDKTAIS
jgi:hypothetical protein